MAFTVPTGWEQLTQEQLRRVLKLLWLYGGKENWEYQVQTAAFLYFCGVKVYNSTDQGWLCEEVASGRRFLLDPEVYPSVMEQLAWITRTEEMTVRIGKVGSYEAVDFLLQDMLFGDYLKAENWFQSYLQGRKERCLVELARILYRVPDGDDALQLCNEVLLGAFLWYAAAKQELARQFPCFLKPASGREEPVTRESLAEGMRAQIRLLTKGDVTKQGYILEKTDTWTALAELDALAREAEEIKRKYGKK